MLCRTTAPGAYRPAVANHARKGGPMRILAEHWHCFLPAAIIIIAALLMNHGEKEKGRNTPSETHSITKHKENDL